MLLLMLAWHEHYPQGLDIQPNIMLIIREIKQFTISESGYEMPAASSMEDLPLSHMPTEHLKTPCIILLQGISSIDPG